MLRSAPPRPASHVLALIVPATAAFAVLVSGLAACGSDDEGVGPDSGAGQSMLIGKLLQEG